ncbi:hypothetical protein LPJ64_003551 [Coemansia asiatica]|uniref:Glutathione S-transferase n=1 Tax=Coemansia asiatica TaxID=1052880 RepID=A0A9W7XJJ5_9FUNG|nr:hypothetical protein LPJ64_003551 [Coemansia asiatica]
MSSTNKSSYVVRYFPIPGLAEPIRILLTAANVEWTEEHPEWPQKKSEQPHGRMPVLIEKDAEGEVETVIAESTTILRYLARKYGFIPADLKQAAYQEQIADFFSDVSMGFHLKRYASKEKMEELNTRFVQMLDKAIEVVTEGLHKNGDNGRLSGDKLSYVDIRAYNLIRHFCTDGATFDEALPSLVSSKLTPEYSKLIATVEADPLLNKYMEGKKSLVEITSQ